MAHSANEPLPTIALITLCALLPGCFVPAKFSGFRPSGPGTLVGSYCVAGVRDTLRIGAPHGVAIFMRASNDDRGRLVSLDIYMEIPDGVSLRLLSPAVGVQSPEWSEPLTLTISEITAPGPRHYPPIAVLPGSSQESMGRFSLWFAPGGAPEARRFRVSLPAMIINGAVFQADAVAFEAYSEWGMYTCAQ